MQVSKLLAALAQSWDEHTAGRGEWSEMCPDLNQCVPTALVVQDYLGGTLRRAPMTNNGGHFWNHLESGVEIDLTAGQFAYLGECLLREEAETRTREDLLDFPDVRRRYLLLKERVERLLNQKWRLNMTSEVDHPTHYNQHPTGVECIDIIEHFNFNVGNAIKYLWRANEKGDWVKDLEKAVWYVQRELARAQTYGKPNEPLA